MAGKPWGCAQPWPEENLQWMIWIYLEAPIPQPLVCLETSCCPWLGLFTTVSWGIAPAS